MRSATFLHTIKRSLVVMSSLMCAFGVFLIFWPTVSAGLIAKVSGVMFILLGIMRITGYFSGDLYRLAFQHDLAFGIVVIALGLLLLIKPATMLNILCFSIGTVIMTDGLLRLQTALDAKRFGLKNWGVILLLAVLTAVFGAFLLFRPGEEMIAPMTFFGVTLLADGALDITTIIASMKILEDKPRNFDDEEED